MDKEFHFFAYIDSIFDQFYLKSFVPYFFFLISSQRIIFQISSLRILYIEIVLLHDRRGYEKIRTTEHVRSI